MDELNIPHDTSPRIVIVGGGFAGLKLASLLRNKSFQVVLIDKHNYHQFQPLIYQVAMSELEPSAISFPFRKIFQKAKNVFFRQTHVLGIDTEKQSITTSLGVLHYNKLVIATGTCTNFFGNNTIKENSMILKSVSDALYMRNQLLRNFEKTVTSTNKNEKQALFNVVIAGGGPTGVEVAGAIAEMKKRIIPKDYPRLDYSLMNIYLVEAGNRLLGTFHEKSSGEVKKYLEKLGVTVLLNTKVENYDGYTVSLQDGNNLLSYNFLWTTGVKGRIPDGVPQEAITRGNRIKANSYNQVEGLNNVYALGDVACITDDKKYPNGHPQLAQPAIQQADNLAKNLKRELQKKPLRPFIYRDLGIMATIGRNAAVVEFPWLKFHGFLAWVVWMFIHLMAILGIKNRLMTLINWMYHYFTFDQSLRLIMKQEKEVE